MNALLSNSGAFDETSTHCAFFMAAQNADGTNDLPKSWSTTPPQPTKRAKDGPDHRALEGRRVNDWIRAPPKIHLRQKARILGVVPPHLEDARLDLGAGSGLGLGAACFRSDRRG